MSRNDNRYDVIILYGEVVIVSGSGLNSQYECWFICCEQELGL